MTKSLHQCFPTFCVSCIHDFFYFSAQVTIIFGKLHSNSFFPISQCVFSHMHTFYCKEHRHFQYEIVPSKLCKKLAFPQRFLSLWLRNTGPHKYTSYTEQYQNMYTIGKRRGGEDHCANDAWIRTLRVFPKCQNWSHWHGCVVSSSEITLIGLALKCCLNRWSPEDHWWLTKTKYSFTVHWEDRCPAPSPKGGS